MFTRSDLTMLMDAKPSPASLSTFRRILAASKLGGIGSA